MGDRNNNYHEIKIPLKDIYQDAEEETFNILERKKPDEKNLIIFPSEYRHSFVPERRITRFNIRSIPGTHALKYLSKFPVVSSDEDMAIFHVSDGLDVAYMKKPGFLDSPDLNERVKELFGKPPIITTASEDEFLNYKAMGVRVEKPRDFILAESNITNKGRIQGNDALCARLYESPDNSVDLDEARELLKKPTDEDLPKLYPNQFIEFIGNQGNVFAMVTPDIDDPKVKLLSIQDKMHYRIKSHHFSTTAGIAPRSLEQYIAVQHALLDPDIKLVTLCGKYGCGKTVLAYSAGIEQVLIYSDEIQKKRGLPYGKERRGRYRQIAIFRPNDPIGGKKRAIGTVPGGLWDKQEHQLGSFISAHEALERAGVPFGIDELLRNALRKNRIGPKRSPKLNIFGGDLPPDCEVIKIYSLADIQGCNFEDHWVIIDEAQNLRHDEIKAIFSRQCETTKYIVLGDTNQIVNEECTEDRNGLVSEIRHYLRYEDTLLFNLTINNRGSISRRAESWRS
jgi:predicted ribonuclease YlaK